MRPALARRQVVRRGCSPCISCARGRSMVAGAAGTLHARTSRRMRQSPCNDVRPDGGPLSPSSRSLVPPGLRELLRELFPGSRLVDASPLRADSDAAADEARSRTAKAAGYGLPVRLRLADASSGAEMDLVFRTASANDFGHDRRSDRAQELLLAFDSFDRIPDHVAALDVGAILDDGRLASLRRAGEFYLLTAYAPGELYAGDLRRIARER